ncbi:FAD-binding and (Fe-S)-binding domain-containing protein [Halodesulfovibrio aestuarii]|uniref:D-lactate dehydrogenase (cytochrome) n=1 Tax=Halodesulfovibrio aestuarii TaxID=126333 RepID=A0ABV4JZR3_9BACT
MHVTPHIAFYNDLLSIIPKKRIYRDPLQVLAYGTDASFYRLIPKMVVDVESEEEVLHILKLADTHRVAVTFRAAGTSLSGQGISDSVLVRIGDAWRNYRITENATRFTVQPGLIGGHANRALLPFGRKIGPDPASIDSAKIGGIVANNASGMCCGVAENSYKTLNSMRLALYDGTLLDTACEESKKRFEEKHPEVVKGLQDIRERVMADKDLSGLIAKKFKIKNTTGYSLNAIVDFDDPYEILQHLMVGSEGSLGFISEVTYRTVIEPKYKATALAMFPSLQDACLATMELKKQPVSAVELMDERSLRSVSDKPGMPDSIKNIAAGTTSLLIETASNDPFEIEEQVKAIIASVDHINKLEPVEFCHDPIQCAKFWAVRKGLFPAVGAVRETGTTVIIEDVAFPPESFADGVARLEELLKKYRYDLAIIFGHALEGNVHFVFTQDFSIGSEIDRYQKFMDEVCTMVATEYKGSLKAEHGTGRNMAPFVELEWGKQAHDLMREIKNLLDPYNLLNPGVIINDDPRAHLTALKPLPVAHDIVDKCIECGFCEPICPSANITFTPRQRITSLRELYRLKDSPSEQKKLKKMWAEYNYLAMETCATDGLCHTLCPVDINTGAMIKDLRAQRASSFANSTADWVGRNFSSVAKGVQVALKGANLAHRLFGTHVMDSGAHVLRVVSMKKIPLWNKEMPTSASLIKPVPINDGNPDKVVYFPSCISRTMGPSKGDPESTDIPQKTIQLLLKAGYEVLFPSNMQNLCCGQAFASKGYTAQGEHKSKELSDALLASSENGLYPVLCDTSPCLHRMLDYMDKRLTLYDPIRFCLECLPDRLDFVKLPRKVAIHPTCTVREMKLVEPLVELANMCAEHVVLPADVYCCGFAGDRGFSFPELNKAALADLPKQVEDCDEAYSTSRTCEVGLSLHSGLKYRNIMYLVDDATVVKKE